ncbi:MAG: cupin domain-containing protein [Dongiaceae bacterium]
MIRATCTSMSSRVVGLVVVLMLIAPLAWAGENDVVTTKILETSVTNTGDPIIYPETDHPLITVAIVEIAPGAATPVHRHPHPMAAYILEGTLEVTAADGTVNLYQAGDALVEALDENHQGRVIGDAPVRIVITVMGVVGDPVSIVQE